MSRVVRKQIALRVQRRARFICEYCKLPDYLGFADFEVDHIIARAHRGPVISTILHGRVGQTHLFERIDSVP